MYVRKNLKSGPALFMLINGERNCTAIKNNHTKY